MALHWTGLADTKTSLLMVCLRVWITVELFAHCPAVSGDGYWLGPKPHVHSRPDIWECLWVWCHLRIRWSQLHIFRTLRSAFYYTAISLSCFHLIHTSYKFGPQPQYTVDFMIYKKHFPTFTFMVFFSLNMFANVRSSAYTDSYFSTEL